MKKILLLLLLSIGTLQITHAQCDFVIGDESLDISVDPTEITLCSTALEDGPLALIGSPPGGDFSGNGLIGNIFNPIITNYPYNSAITYTHPDCADPVTLIVWVIAPDLAAEANITDSFICENDDPIALTGNVDNLGGTFLTEEDRVITEFDPADFGVGEHLIFYAYIDTTTGCVSQQEIRLNVTAAPSAAIETFLEKEEFCINESPVSLVAVESIDELAGPGIEVGSTIFDPALAGVGRHEIVHIYEQLSGVCRVDTTHTIEVLPAVVADFQSLGMSCTMGNDTLVYVGDPLDPTVAFNWEVDGGAVVYNGGDTLVVEWNPQSGNPTITLTLDNLECPIDPIIKPVNLSNVTVTTIPETTIQPGTPITLETTATSASPTGEPITYNWIASVGSVACPDCQSPNVSPEQTTTYTVIAMDAEGCSGTANVTINIETNKKIFVPNVFTPNDDGRNDELALVGTNIESSIFRVFNRYGALIFESQDTNIGWDGTYKGQAVNSGVYIYYAEVTFFGDPEPLVQKGNVTIIR